MLRPGRKRSNLIQTVPLLAVAVDMAAPPAQAANERLPKPKDIALTTKDGVQLKGTFYPSTEGSREKIVPVVLLHDYKETRAVYDDLARQLQAAPLNDSTKAPRAVLTIDFRGHGESKTATTIQGNTVELDAANFRNPDFEAMVRFDMEAVRGFLVDKNNSGQLNLNQLCLVGSGMGANVAVLWTATDWSMPPLPRLKQGQDVKALVLVSPRWKYRGLPLLQAIKHPAVQREISIFLAYGEKDRKVAKDAENIYQNFERFHPEPPRDKIAELKDLYRVGVPTTLQGTELLTKRQFDLAPLVDIFIERRLGSKDFTWINRTVQ